MHVKGGNQVPDEVPTLTPFPAEEPAQRLREASAGRRLARRERDGSLTAAQAAASLKRLRYLKERWHEVQPSVSLDERLGDAASREGFHVGARTS